MSSSEEKYDIDDISGDESEGYSPVAKRTTKVVPKATAKPKSKALSKPRAAPKKALADVDENAEESFRVDEGDDSGPSAPRPAPAPKNKKSASETYTKLSQLEHILKRPDSYIGSVEFVTQNIWTYDRKRNYVPGFFKIIDEILVNAADNKINDPSMDTLKVEIDVENGTISVYNNGRGIPIEIHSKEKIYIPELIFGHLLSSSNYDDDEKKLTGAETKYKQTWTDNMGKCGKAKITKNPRGEDYTRVSFTPDLQRFGMTSIDPDTVSLLKKRVYDMAGTVKDVKTAAENAGGAAQAKQSVIYERVDNRWEVGFAVSDGTFQHVSFANSISTIKGGSHVNYIADQIAKNLITAITKKNKAAAIKIPKIKEHIWIFVNALIENPTFDSQTKETMTLVASKFGSKPTLSEDFMKKVSKSSIVENVLNWAKFRADQQIKKTDGTKRNRLTGVTKLADANNAGTRQASQCTLILTEGDSAKALAVAGLGVVGRDNFGVFPLRGKLLNVREAKHEQIMKNEEIQNIKKIMGLQHNKDYSNVASLRYGQLMIMTDQDHDGSHIKGLLINFLDHFFPSLLKIPNFLVEFVTPIVRVTKGKQRIDFFTIPEYEQWLEQTPDPHKWDSKYYKGLGTSKDSDARDYFSHMAKHMIPFGSTQDGDRELIDLAFSKKKADERKDWLRHFRPGTYLNHDTDEISYSDFINKELILFSMADNVRSIPSVADGLKPGQRKVIWGCFKRKLKKEIKVAQLVGYISEHAAYHHGEQSLTMTIVNLAQDYVGSNNLNLLLPNGQYGTRDQGGKDHASARYIFTEPAPITRTIFHPSDDPLLDYLKEDNDGIEPEWYMPVIPLVLVNGAEGIGTGWSTSIPSYNPKDVVMNIRRLMAGEEQETMLPWWRGFKGTIKKTGEHKYDVTGIATKVNDTTTYKAELEVMIGEKGDGMVKDYKEHHDNVNVHFVVNMAAKDLEKAEEQGLTEFFKLTSKINTSNMICFDFEGKIKKYNSPEEIIEEFYPKRLAYYQKRKDFLANELQLQFEKLSNQARFVKMIIDKELVVSNRKKADIIEELRQKKFRPFPKATKGKAAGENEDVEGANEEADEAATGTSTDYDYLLGMAIWSLTKEKIEKLRQQGVEKEKELLALLELTPIQIWNTDLDHFLEEWDRAVHEWVDKAVMDSSGKKVKRKQATLKTRKSIGSGKRGGGDDSGDDDDFMPTKKAAAAKARKPVVPATGTSRARPKAKRSDDEMSFDDEPPPPIKKRAAPEKKAPFKIEPSSDMEMADDPLPPKEDAPPMKVKSDDDEDSGDNLIREALAKGKGKATQARKRRSLGDEEDDKDAYIKPAKKAKSTTQASMKDFLGKKPPVSKAVAKPPSKTTARKASGSTKALSKKAATKGAESSGDDILMDDPDSAPVAPRAAAPRRAAAKVAYIELSDNDEDED
ncbi:type II DNA topoisomerase [Multifurca ochricompacta]|uniref:DNA topoisomerase 2 n=1 Tax=Multifurca ochricompacta TaxID=376703 RepID=A0AAD4M0C1_9AGAM|nr:type II DNA topoisomerase [Multifurca ochricompacta]